MCDYTVSIDPQKHAITLTQLYEDKRLSPQAFTLFSQIMYESGRLRRITKKLIFEVCPWLTEHMYKKTMRELEDFGYIERVESRGRFGFCGMTVRLMLPEIEKKKTVGLTLKQFLAMRESVSEPGSRQTATASEQENSENKTPDESGSCETACASYITKTIQYNQIDYSSTVDISDRSEQKEEIDSKFCSVSHKVGERSKRLNEIKKSKGYRLRNVDEHDANEIIETVSRRCSDHRYDSDQIPFALMQLDGLCEPRTTRQADYPELWARCICGGAMRIADRQFGETKRLLSYWFSDYGGDILSYAETSFDAELMFVARSA